MGKEKQTGEGGTEALNGEVGGIEGVWVFWVGGSGEGGVSLSL